MATTKIPTKFLRWLKRLTDEGVDFLLVGGYAVVLHGYVRNTGDIDFWVEPEVPNASKIMRIAEELGDPLPPDAIMRLSIHRSVIRMGIDPFRIDLMTSCDGCDWSTAWKHRQYFDIDGLQVPVISLEDLKAAKRAAGRHKYLDDLENLP